MINENNQDIAIETSFNAINQLESNKENLILEIETFKLNNIYLINEDLEQKIPQILSFLQNPNNSLDNKITILKYLSDLFTKVEFNAETFLHKSQNNVNLFQIIIHQYITCIDKNENFRNELKNIFSILLSHITFDKNLYKYILSFIINYLDSKNNNVSFGGNNSILNAQILSNILELLHFYYQIIQGIKNSINYLYMNTNNNEYLTILNKEKENKKKILNFDEILNIVLFIKLPPHNLIKNINTKFGLIELSFNDETRNISFEIDNEFNLITNYNSNDKKLKKLPSNEPFNILFKFILKDTFKIEIYLNNEKVNLANEQLTLNETDKKIIKEKFEIKSFNLFKQFIGQCYNIIIFKTKKNEKLPKFMLQPKSEAKKNQQRHTISTPFDVFSSKNAVNPINNEIEIFEMKKIFANGIYDENLFSLFLKSELKDEVDYGDKFNKVINNNQDKIIQTDIKDFLEKNIVAIYLPSRYDIINNNKIILYDSINHLNAELITNNLSFNNVHILTKLTEDLSQIGGLTHLIPFLELMVNYKELLTIENITNFSRLISLIFSPIFKSLLLKESNCNFFMILSFFLEKLPEEFFTSQIVGNLINISSILMSFIEENDFNQLIEQFHEFILFNEKLFYKFKYEEQKAILEQIKVVFNLLDSSKVKKEINIKFSMTKIINILLYYDKEKYSKFCCKQHSIYFNNNKNNVMKIELYTLITPLSDIIKIKFKQFTKETDINNLNELSKELFKLFGLLTVDISPCLQKFIIKLFNEFFNDNNKNFEQNMTNYGANIFDICLFIFGTSIFNVKIYMLNLLNNLFRLKQEVIKKRLLSNKIKDNKNKDKDKDKNKDKDKDILPDINIDNEKEIYLIYYILPYFLLKRVNHEKLKEKLYINGAQYNYRNISFTENENNLFNNYNQVILGNLKIELYKNILSFFIEGYNIDLNIKLLIQIVTKSNINLILNFITELEKLPNNKKDIIYLNQNILHFLLETNFQATLVRNSNYDKNKYISEFINDDTENINFKKNIETLIKVCNDLLINIFTKYIYKLDYLLTWGKYYFEVYKNDIINKNNFKEFILKILNEIDNKYIPKEILIPDKIESLIGLQKDALYYINILFEFCSYYNFNPFNDDESLKIDNVIYEDLFKNFCNILVKNNIDDKDFNFITSINEKWKEFSFTKKIYTYFINLWNNDNKFNKEENDIYIKYIDGKKNQLITELAILFYSFEELPEFSNNNSNNYINKGIYIIQIINHFFILAYNLGGTKDEIKNLLNNFRSFLILIIISSTTLTITSDKKKQKWPNEDEYKFIQMTIKNILFIVINFFYNNIKNVDEILKTASKEKNDYEYIKNLLYINFGYLLKVINTIYREVKKADNKKNKKGFGVFSKMKNLFGESEYIKKSGLFILMELFYKETNFDIKEDLKNYLDEIPHIDFKSNKADLKLEECIQNLINDQHIKSFLETQDTDLSKDKIFPFVPIITKRALLKNNFIPCYDNKLNIKENLNENLCLVPDYFRESEYDKTLKNNIKEINRKIIKDILFEEKKNIIENKHKINLYKKDKKKLFSYLGLWSNLEYFYNKEKYDIKYKLVNHYTEDYLRVLVTPILDINYYLPTFSEYDPVNIFRSKNNKRLVYRCADLSFALNNKPKIFKEDEENIEDTINNDKSNIIDYNTNKYNLLYDIKLNYYNNLRNIDNKNNIEELEITTNLLFEYLKNKYLKEDSQYYMEVNCCWIKTPIHITGVFINNDKGLIFYGYNKKRLEDEEDYESERKTCYGSIFKPQIAKYNYNYLFIPYNEIDFILKRRYFYKKTCLEIYTINKKSYLFRFDSSKIKAVSENIKYFLKPNYDDILIEYTKFEEKIGIYNKQTSLRNGTEIPFKNKNLSLKNIYESWAKWQISTAKFLMLINFYANRSYNDIFQYPVFPWIITDYTSKLLPNINTENFIRPFGTPMGMLEISPESIKRKNSYIEQWKLNELDEEQTENYGRYGSNYSSSLYVSYYLVRVFPYSTMMIELQGRNFDDPNRLFNSLASSFKCSTSQKTDLRELIPEIFCFPELFYNYNDLNLGEMEDKNENLILVNDVKMPEWCNNNAYEFIYKYRKLLECKEISEKINEWLNIIFGSKQKGNAAKKIGNLFLNYSYEDFKDEYHKSKKEDKKVLRKMYELGVVPNQIFKNDINKKQNYDELKSKIYLLPNITEYLKNLNEIVDKNNYIDLLKEIVIEEPSFHIFGTPRKLIYYQSSKNKQKGKDKKRIYILFQDKIKIYKRSIDKIQQQTTTNIDIDNTNKQNNDQNKNEEKTEIIKLNISQKREKKLLFPRYRLENSPIIFYDTGNCVVLGGFWNGNIIIENTEDLKKVDDKNIKTKKNIVINTNENSPITQISLDDNELFAVCGNKQGSVFIYTINQNEKISWTFYEKLHDHENEISSIAINDNLNMFITTSKDGYCMIYTLPKIKLVNSFKLISNSFNNISENENEIFYPNMTFISHTPLPCYIFYIKSRNSLSIFSINGHFINEKKIDFEINNNCIKKITDNQFVDYLLIFNNKNNNLDIYNIMELNVVISLPSINHIFVDFIINDKLDHILFLVKYKGKSDNENCNNEKGTEIYKILIMRNQKNEIEWK